MNTIIVRNIAHRAFFATFLTFLLNTIGSYFDLYSIFWWYDMPMHFLGGLFTSLLLLYVLIKYFNKIVLNFGSTFIVIITLSLIVGLLWEGYELFLAILSGNRHILLDSISDICFDIAGAAQGMLIYKRQLSIFK
jgi:hypothetical protein